MLRSGYIYFILTVSRDYPGACPFPQSSHSCLNQGLAGQPLQDTQ